MPYAEIETPGASAKFNAPGMAGYGCYTLLRDDPDAAVFSACMTAETAWQVIALG